MSTWPWPFRLLWGHNPSYYDTATMAPYWRSTLNCAIDPTGGLNGSGALIFDESTSGMTSGPQEIEELPNFAAKWPRVVPDPSNFMCGSRFWLDANPADTVPVYIAMEDAGFANMSLCVDASGYVSVWRGIPYATHPLHEELWNAADAGLEPLAPSTHHRLGFICNIAHVNGWFDVYIDGVHATYQAGLSTHVHGSVLWAGMGFGGAEGMRHSHMYLGSGIPHYNAKIRRGGFLSAVKYPAADGTFTDWVSNTASISTAIDDTVPDDPTTIIESETSGQTYSVSVDDVIGSRAILGCQLATRFLRPDLASVNALRQAVIVNDVVYPANQIASGNDVDWSVEQYLWLTDPSNGMPFTRARLNNPAITQWGGIAHGSL